MNLPAFVVPQSLPAQLNEELDGGLLDESFFRVDAGRRLEKLHLVFVWDREYSDNDPWIRRESMKLFQRTQK